MSCEKIFQQIIARGFFRVNTRLCVHANRVLAVRFPFNNVLVDYLDERGKISHSTLFDDPDDSDSVRNSGPVW